MTQPPSSPPVRVVTEGGVTRITLDAPDRLNAVTASMLDAVSAALEDVAGRADVRVVVLTGSGRGFCSGADLSRTDDGSVDHATLYAVGRAVRAITAAPQAVLALVNGVAAGAGASLALAADYVLATESASFVLAFGRIGLMPDGGATQLVAANLGRARAMRLALLAEKLSAPDAAAAGLVAEVVDDARFADRSQELVARLAASAPRATELTKRAINAATLDLDATLAREEEGQSRLLGTADFLEGATAFIERRPPRFEGR